MEEVLLDRYILSQLDAYDLDLSEDDWDEMPKEQLSDEVLELL